MRYSTKWPEYAKQWDRMRINASRVAEFKDLALYAIKHKAIYLEVEDKTGVHWYHVAVLHRREADGDFNAYLGNGQKLSRRTTIDPRGRGPFLEPGAFLKGAIDALRIDGLSSIKDWRLEKMLYYAEVFNGTGYDMRGLPSPYNWGGTNIQRPGKYVEDRKWKGRVMDGQPGCAPLLYMIAQIDDSVKFVRED